jgi:hypothetical protein
MEATIHSSASLSQSVSTTRTKTKSNFWENAEFNRFGVIAFVLSIVACTSGIIAAFFVDMSSQLEITLIAAPTMITLCSILIVAPMRWIVGVGVFALIIDLLVMVI